MGNVMQQKVREELGREKTRERMVRAARRVVGARESEDAAHDAVVQALAAAARFRAEAQVTTWLHRIAFNAALMNHRSSARGQQRLSRARDHAADARWLGEGTAEEIASVALETDESRRILRQAVARLPETYRRVIELVVYDEQDPGRASHALGITPSAVRTRFSRAQHRLRALVAAEG
jgi:RNA polymerase sigma-70 factor (ECF subfamily)